MKSFSVCLVILGGIVVNAAVKYGMRVYEERIETARLQKKKDKEEKKSKKYGKKN